MEVRSASVFSLNLLNFTKKRLKEAFLPSSVPTPGQLPWGRRKGRQNGRRPTVTSFLRFKRFKLKTEADLTFIQNQIRFDCCLMMLILYQIYKGFPKGIDCGLMSDDLPIWRSFLNASKAPWGELPGRSLGEEVAPL